MSWVSAEYIQFMSGSRAVTLLVKIDLDQGGNRDSVYGSTKHFYSTISNISSKPSSLVCRPSRLWSTGWRHNIDD